MGLIFRRETSNKVNQKCKKKKAVKKIISFQSEFIFFLSNVEGGIFRNIRDLGALEPVLLPLLYSLS